MRRIRPERWLAPALALLLVGTVAADDRDFLRELRAPPILFLILDASGSMVGTPEFVPGLTRGMPAAAQFGLLPGAGDDPRSRMGIAKSVLLEFIDRIDDAHIALSRYPAYVPDELALEDDIYPVKHHVYEFKGAFETSSDRLTILSVPPSRFSVASNTHTSSSSTSHTIQFA